jgi:hypothetical protein
LLSDIGLPGADNPPIYTAPCVNDAVNATADLTETPNARFSVISPVIHYLEHTAFEDLNGASKIHTMLGKVPPPLGLIPFERASHSRWRLSPTFLMPDPPESAA